MKIKNSEQSRNVIKRDDLRSFLWSKNITTTSVTYKQIRKLHRILREKLKDSGLYDGTFRMRRIGTKNYKFLTCTSGNFEKREAVSFNPDGFIGFAGWADNKNIVPILDGVYKWALEITEELVSK